ncbi:hypothetical protein [Burkholderia sp. S-53]|uniref:hypothetical protein n=1 Tax=Burkholderia sp. S-53 TaxID=2906514 RepID=UPI0021CF5EC7|nr:hypothetical protein [Burkholderia sp. S-53]UXU91131.1 hypothetical protein LXM88_23435 [Burkholderia sp. S-53]
MRTLFRLSASVALARTARCAAARGTWCGRASSSSSEPGVRARRRAAPIRVARSRHTGV